MVNGKNTSIWATDRPEDAFDIGCRVVKWDEAEGFNLAKTWKYTPTKCNDLDSLQKKISQFTVHWSVTYRAKHMYNGLKARGLSVNFMIDDDCDENGFATIYQCLPISKLGWSQGSLNGRSFNGLGPGVELSFMPQAWDDEMYDAGDQAKWNVPPHEKTKGRVHGTTLTVYKPTEAQMKSLKCLIWGFSELFPDVPAEFPKDDSGNLITGQLKKPHDYKGLCNHYNLRRAKIDCAGLDTESIEDDVAEMKALGYNIFRTI